MQKFSVEELPEICIQALLAYLYEELETKEELMELYKDVIFSYEEITVQEAKRRWLEFNNNECLPFDDFEPYHQWYVEGGDIPDHGDSVYPVIAPGYDEWLEDGWHRFHSYILHYPDRKIPVLTFI